MSTSNRCANSRNILLVFLLVFGSNTTLGFDPRTHLWVGQEVLNDVIPDGKVTIDGREYAVPDQVVQAIKSHPEFYRMGNVGPDASPDMIVGQYFLHPGVEGAWGADDWGKWIQDGARQSSPEAIAYSAGYWAHMAGDMVAHTYINIYAGDYFLLYDEQEVELRHFVLEHYIGDRTPPLVHLGNPVIFKDAIKAPSEFLARSLILNDTVAEQYLKSPAAAAHLIALYRLHKSVHDLRVTIEKFEDPLKSRIVVLDGLRDKLKKDQVENVAKIAKLATSLKPLIVQIKLLEEAVNLQKTINKRIEDTASAGEKAILAAADELDGAERRIAEATAKLEHNVEDAISKGERELKKLQDKLGDLQDQLAPARKEIDRLKDLKVSLEDEVSKAASKLDGFANRLVPGYKQAKNALNSVTGKLDDAKRGLSNAEQNFDTLVANIGRMADEVDRTRRRLADHAAEKSSLESLLSTLAIARTVATQKLNQAKAELGDLNEPLKKARDALLERVKPFVLASKELVKLQRELQKLEDQRNEWIDQARDLTKQLLFLSNLQDAFFLGDRAVVEIVKHWETDLIRCAAAYTSAAADVLTALINHDPDPLLPLKKWFDCWAPVFTGVPSKVTNATCDAKAYLRDLADQLKNVAEELAMQLPLVKDVVTEIERLRELIKKEAVKAGIEFADRIYGKAFTKFYLLHNRQYTDKDLDQAFATDSSGKQLVKFQNFSEIVRKDLGMIEGDSEFNKDTFAVAKHAVTMAKLTLLDAAAVEAFAGAYGITGDDNIYAKHTPKERRQFLYPDSATFVNLLYKGVRSIDGNQAWRGKGLPYIRRDDKFENTKHNGFGYCLHEDPVFRLHQENPSSDEHQDPTYGFRMWVVPEYREKVFAKVFPGELKLASLAPGIKDKIPVGLQEFENKNLECGDMDDATGGAPSSGKPPAIRGDAARSQLEKERFVEIEDVPAVKLIDRIDKFDHDQVIAALREQLRGEVMEEILKELRGRQHWGQDYEAQWKEAFAAHMPLLVVIEGDSPAGAFTFDKVLADEMMVELIRPFVLCKLKWNNDVSLRILSPKRSVTLPIAILIDPSTNTITRSNQGPFRLSDWAEILVQYRQQSKFGR